MYDPAVVKHSSFSILYIIITTRARKETQEEISKVFVSITDEEEECVGEP